MNLKITITSVRHSKESANGSFWVILNTNLGICKGFMRWDPVEGERISVNGDYEIFRGEKQFKFTSSAPDIPGDPRARLHYTCEISVGLGPAAEESIWNEWGAEWEANARPGIVKGLSGTKWEALVAARAKLTQNQAQVAVVTWCLSKGLTWNQADKAWAEWKLDAVKVISDNPYKISDLPQYGYNDADKVARAAFGITEHDPRRIRAGLRYCLSKLCESGSTVVSWQHELRPEALKLFGAYYEEDIEEAHACLSLSGSFVDLGDGLTSTVEAFRAETAILEYIKKG